MDARTFDDSHCETGIRPTLTFGNWRGASAVSCLLLFANRRRRAVRGVPAADCCIQRSVRFGDERATLALSGGLDTFIRVSLSYRCQVDVRSTTSSDEAASRLQRIGLRRQG